MSESYGRPTDNDLRQIVQLAAIKYDSATGAEIDFMNVLTFPKYIKQVPDFFTQLTGITQEDIDQKAIDFPDAYDTFLRFCEGSETSIYTFDNDWQVMRQNTAYFKLAFKFEDQPFIRVKKMLPRWGIDPDTYSSGTLHNAAGIQMEGHVHNALHDVRSMAAAVRFFESQAARAGR